MRCLSRISASKLGDVSASRRHLLLHRLTCEVKADFLLLCLIFIIFFIFVSLLRQEKTNNTKAAWWWGTGENLTLLLPGPYIIWNKQLLRCLRVGVHP